MNATRDPERPREARLPKAQPSCTDGEWPPFGRGRSEHRLVRHGREAQRRADLAYLIAGNCI